MNKSLHDMLITETYKEKLMAIFKESIDDAVKKQSDNAYSIRSLKLYILEKQIVTKRSIFYFSMHILLTNCKLQKN